jgi:hypothetical protein
MGKVKEKKTVPVKITAPAKVVRNKTKKVVPPTPADTDKIFIQIASYRDPELLPTLMDCLENAKYPERLVFGIAWQHSSEDAWDTLYNYKNDPRFKIIDIDYTASKGVCWARSQIGKLWNGEKYTLQLDSHHRFVKDWDVKCIDMFNGLLAAGHTKPLISGYIPSYDPDNDPGARLVEPWVLIFDRFAPDGVVHFRPEGMLEPKDKPQPARFISAHFIFTFGIFCKEVPYDTSYYFHGEELNLSIRAFMMGYDLFHPNEILVWHEYTRHAKKKHWDDHADWPELVKSSNAHNMEVFGIDGTNTKKTLKKGKTFTRSLRDYEKYAGLDFATRRVHKVVTEKIPPVAMDDITFESGLQYYRRYCLDVYRGSLALEDYDLWVVAFEDADGNTIYREDANEDQLKGIIGTLPDDKFLHIWRSFFSEKPPVKWVVWGHSKSADWAERVEGSLL